MKRTDAHRPSVIDPKEYTLVAYDYLGSDVNMIDATKEDRVAIRAACLLRGISYADCLDKLTSQCQCCGAHALYYGVFYHPKTNVMLWLGHICAYKMGLVKKGDFVAYRKGLNTRMIHVKNLEIARKFCKEQGIDLEKEAPLELSESWAANVLRDLWSKCVQYHKLTDKQVEFAKKLINQLQNPQPVVAEKPKEAAVEGRYEVTGTVLGFKLQETGFGQVRKALVETEKGWKLFVTVPSGAE